MFGNLKNVKVNYALLAFLAFTAKVMVYSPTVADSIIMGVLAGLYGYSQYLRRFQPVQLDEAVAKELLEVRQALSKLNLLKLQEKREKPKYF